MNNGAKILHNYNIEKGLLSALIFNPSQIDSLDIELSSKLFYFPFHVSVYETIVELIQINKPVVEEFIISNLQKQNHYNEDSFLEILSASPLTDVNAHIKELLDLSIKRELQNLSFGIQKKLSDSNTTEEIMDSIDTALLSLSKEQHEQGFVGMIDVLKEANVHIKEMESKKDGLIGIDTGFTKLNGLTSGFSAGDLIILAARPSMGKTSLALNIMLETAKVSNGVALLSLEMPREQIAFKMISMISGIPLQDIRSGRIKELQKESFVNANNLISRLNIVIDDTSVMTIGKIKSKLKKIVAKNSGIKLIVLDYLQLVDANDNRDRHLQVSEISRGLKIIARELGVAIMALSQLNRSLESRADKRPMLSDLRESGAIEQDADTILFIYRDDVYKKQEDKQKESEFRKKGIEYSAENKEEAISPAELIIGKQRNGPLGVVELEFVKKNASFREKEISKSTVFEVDYK